MYILITKSLLVKALLAKALLAKALFPLIPSISLGVLLYSINWVVLGL